MRFFGWMAVLMWMGACSAQSPEAPTRPTSIPTEQTTVPEQPPGPSIDVLAHVFTWHIKNERQNEWGNVTTIPWRSDGNGVGYDSTDTAIIVEQAAEMRAHGLTPLVSWRGSNQAGGDQFLNAWRSVVSDLPAAILYEGQARLQRDRDGWWTVTRRANARALRDDLTHLYRVYLQPEPARWYRRHDKFVIYLWPGHAMRGNLQSVIGSLPFRDQLYVVTTEFDGLRLPQDARMEMLTGVDAVTGYGFYSKPLMSEYPVDAVTGKVPLPDALIERYRDAALAWQMYLSERLPGVELILPLELAFDDSLMPYRDNPLYEASPEQAQKIIDEIRQMIDHHWTTCGTIVPAITYPSYNEHFEGTALEPNDRYGTQWIELINESFAQAPLSHSPCR